MEPIVTPMKGPGAPKLSDARQRWAVAVRARWLDDLGKIVEILRDAEGGLSASGVAQEWGVQHGGVHRQNWAMLRLTALVGEGRARCYTWMAGGQIILHFAAVDDEEPVASLGGSSFEIVRGG